VTKNAIQQFYPRTVEQFDIWITFLRHHMHELQTFKNAPFLWPTPYMFQAYYWISLFTRKSGSNKKGEKQTHKLN